MFVIWERLYAHPVLLSFMCIGQGLLREQCE